MLELELLSRIIYTVLSQKTSGSFGAVKKAADTEFSLKFAGDDSAKLISVCVSASLSFDSQPDTGNLVLSPFRDFPIDMQPSLRLSVSSVRG